jgi:hypothetical protein
MMLRSSLNDRGMAADSMPAVDSSQVARSRAAAHYAAEETRNPARSPGAGRQAEVNWPGYRAVPHGRGCVVLGNTPMSYDPDGPEIKKFVSDEVKQQIARALKLAAEQARKEKLELIRQESRAQQERMPPPGYQKYVKQEIALLMREVGALGVKTKMIGVRKQVESAETAAKILTVRFETLAKEIETLKKNAVSTGDLAAIGKEIAALKKK